MERFVLNTQLPLPMCIVYPRLIRYQRWTIDASTTTISHWKAMSVIQLFHKGGVYICMIVVLVVLTFENQTIDMVSLII